MKSDKNRSALRTKKWALKPQAIFSLSRRLQSSSFLCYHIVQKMGSGCNKGHMPLHFCTPKRIQHIQHILCSASLWLFILPPISLSPPTEPNLSKVAFVQLCAAPFVKPKTHTFTYRSTFLFHINTHTRIHTFKTQFVCVCVCVSAIGLYCTFSNIRKKYSLLHTYSVHDEHTRNAALDGVFIVVVAVAWTLYDMGDLCNVRELLKDEKCA